MKYTLDMFGEIFYVDNVDKNVCPDAKIEDSFFIKFNNHVTTKQKESEKGNICTFFITYL